MKIEDLRKENELVDLFCSLAEIPSPSMKEQNVSDWIRDYCEKNNIPFRYDDYGNVCITVPATDNTKDSLLLSSHMDVIGDNSPVKVYLDGNLIGAEGRTLGGDNKAGVANILLAAKEIVNSDIKHGGLEVIFTRDEESGMTGIRHVDFSKLNSKYVLVCDSDSLGDLCVSGAGYTIAKLTLRTFKGGHSGIDIADPARENAAKLIADLIADLPQGVFESDRGIETITSCNIGGIRAGDLSVTNVINTFAEATYSIRSSNKESEQKLKDMMLSQLGFFNEEYEGVALAEMTFEEHLPMFEKSPDEFIPILFETAAVKSGIAPIITSFHAGAETHIYACHKNAKGEQFVPYLMGLATVYSMHSADEMLDYKTLLQGHKLLRTFFDLYNG